MDENFLQSILNPSQPGLSDQYSAGALQAPQPAALDPTAQAPATLPDQYSAAGMQAQPEQPLTPPPGVPDASNFLQAVAPDPQHPVVAAVNALQGGAAPAAPNGTIPAAAPRARHSILDVIGHLADAVATVGGSKPGYQSGLDAETARQNALQDRAATQIKAAADAHTQQLGDAEKVATTANTQMSTRETALKNSASQNAITERVLTATKADIAAGADPATALAKHASLFKNSLDPADVANLSSTLASDPSKIDGLITDYGTASTDGKFGLNLTLAKKPDGTYGYYQPSSDGEGHFVDGVSADPKLSFQNLGDREVGVGPDGKPIVSLKKNATPGEVMDHDYKIQDLARKTAADAAKAAKPGGKGSSDPYGEYATSRGQITRMSKAIDDLVADPNLKGATGFAMGAVDTPARTAITARYKAIEGMAIPVAAAMLKQQGVQRPAQVEIMSTAKGLISDLGLYRQNTDGYISGARAAQSRLHALVGQMDDTALRTGVISKDGTAAPRAAPAAPRAPAAPVRRVMPAGRSTVSNW